MLPSPLSNETTSVMRDGLSGMVGIGDMCKVPRVRILNPREVGMVGCL